MPKDARAALDDLQALLIDHAWRQWSALGEAAARPPRTIVDIEALLLASGWLGRFEGRLPRAAATWRASFDHLVSTQRLRNLASRAAPWLGGVEAAGGAPPLPAAAEGDPPRRAPRQPLAHPGSATLLLRLRLLLSVGAKADLITLLLGRRADAALPDWVLQHEVAYGQHAVRRVTKDLAWSGVLASSRDGQHGLRDADAWFTLLGLTRPQLPIWLSWATIYPWTEAAHHIIADAITRDVSSYGLGSRLDELSASLGPMLPATGPLGIVPAAVAETGIAGFIRRCEQLAHDIRSG